MRFNLGRNPPRFRLWIQIVVVILSVSVPPTGAMSSPLLVGGSIAAPTPILHTTFQDRVPNQGVPAISHDGIHKSAPQPKCAISGRLGGECPSTLPIILQRAIGNSTHANWNQLPSSSDISCGNQLVYDAADRYLLCAEASVNKTWLYSNGSWTVDNLTSTPDLQVTTYDAADGYVLGFSINETWKFVGGLWTQVYPIPHPSVRFPAMEYDSTDGYVLLFGGLVGNTPVNSSWLYRAGSWTNITGSHSPPSGGKSRLADDPPSRSVVLYGSYISFPNGPLVEENLTWEFSNGSWKNVTHSVQPGPGPNVLAPQLSVLMNYDPSYRHVIAANRTQMWVLTDENWTAFRPTRYPTFPSTIGMGIATYDPVLSAWFLIADGNSTPFPTWIFGSAFVRFNVSTQNDGSVFPFASAQLNTSSSLTTDLGFGNDLIWETAQPWAHFSHWAVSGNLSMTLIYSGGQVVGDQLSVLGPGAVTAFYVETPRLSFHLVPSTCGTISFNGSAVGDGTSSFFLHGSYSASAISCATGLHFYRWLGSKNVSIANASSATTTVRLATGNGTLSAFFASDVTLVIDHPQYGSVDVNGTPFQAGRIEELIPGSYSVQAIADPWGKFAGWSTTGTGVTLSGSTLTVTGVGDGTLWARFGFYPEVRLVVNASPGAPAPCTSVTIDGQLIESGHGTRVSVGTYPIYAGNCTSMNELFHRWVSSRNLTIQQRSNSSTQVEVAGNGTLTAEFVPAFPVEFIILNRGQVELNASKVSSLQLFLLLGGTYPLKAMADSGYRFENWSTSGAVSVSGSTLVVVGSGTVTADFVAITPSGNSSSAHGGEVANWWWKVGLPISAVAGGVLLAVIVHSLRARKRE